ncbi:aldo/keto reductase [Alteromonas oceanisediminis]|uniref:aldo/keto reductase n=1 Tax=Alteromonas oceanisediminis TaxID=2836180 RepID=UPI001BDA71C3|nr:aldo/keto reductase [Alteromonas oceanisediminis]MBT0588158.1 aldo/keto reductase [Alteromonas oceanisediminis]
MQFKSLGSSGIQVSEVCLGTMTWGIQNTQQDADAQLTQALDAQVNFIDTAEMYPVPPNQETYGDTERIIGDWLRRNSAQRGDVVLMTKIAGNGLNYIRNGRAISGETVTQAISESLHRLHTDYIDVYQLHWPNRMSPHFAKHWPNRVLPSKTDVAAEKQTMAGIVRALGEAINAGKIRHWGLSDDTPWGIQTYINLCDELNVPRPVSIQNEFSLLHAKDWPYVIETCAFENVAYLPWSPLASGALSGKYLNGNRPKGSRWTLAQRMGLFRDTPETQRAVAEYIGLANAWNITPSQLALAWCKQIDGVTSTIIGATTQAQLNENLAAFEITLTSEQMQRVLDVFKRYPAPF